MISSNQAVFQKRIPDQSYNTNNNEAINTTLLNYLSVV